MYIQDVRPWQCVPSQPKKSKTAAAAAGRSSLHEEAPGVSRRCPAGSPRHTLCCCNALCAPCAGFPTRKSFRPFAQRYKLLLRSARPGVAISDLSDEVGGRRRVCHGGHFAGTSVGDIRLYGVVPPAGCSVLCCCAGVCRRGFLASDGSVASKPSQPSRFLLSARGCTELGLVDPVL